MTQTRTAAITGRSTAAALIILVMVLSISPIFATKPDNNIGKQETVAVGMKEYGYQSPQAGISPTQTGNLLVRVIDNSSGKPIFLAAVVVNYLVSAMSGTAVGGYTNQSGYVLFTAIPIYQGPSEGSIYVGKSDYINQTVPLSLSSGRTTEVTVSLVSSSSSFSNVGIVLLASILSVLLVPISVSVIVRRRRGNIDRNVSQPHRVVETLDEARERINTLYSRTHGEDAQASFGTPTPSKTMQTPVELSGMCMICGLKFGQGDPVARCPHCGYGAHLIHMLEWLHVKDYCPVCHRHLNEGELLTPSPSQSR